jgi:hypothetical protein
MSHNPYYRRFPPSLAPLALVEARRRTGATHDPGQGRIERTLAAILARPIWLWSGNSSPSLMPVCRIGKCCCAPASIWETRLSTAMTSSVTV